MSNSPVNIVGGGLAGLVAGIRLAECGRTVTVYDRPRNSRYRSVHTSRFNLDKTCEYIGIDLTNCFRRVTTETVYFYGRRLVRRNQTYACERGLSPESLDSTLRRNAVRAGVNIVERKVTFDDDILRHGQTILATGLDPYFYRRLGISHTMISGQQSNMSFSHDVTLTSYVNSYTNEDFAYMASMNGIIYTLLFSRNGLDIDSLDKYQVELRQTTGLEFPEWSGFEGCIPNKPRLTSDELILAGTLGGVIDPFFLSGVVAALVSATIAAEAVVDPQNAQTEYNRLVKYFGIKQYLHRLMQWRLLPGRTKFPVIALHSIIGDVGKV